MKYCLGLVTPELAKDKIAYMGVSKLRIELTNKCNLACRHCLRKINPRSEHIPLKTILQIIKKAKPYNINNVSFTGGEATLHPQFEEIINIFSKANYTFNFVTNGMNFSRIYKKITKFKCFLADIRFSLDGARESTHDKNRGDGSYGQVMESIKICQKEKLPFSLLTVITEKNKGELMPLAKLAVKTSCNNLFFAHLLLTERIINNNLALSITECLSAEKIVYRLKNIYKKKMKIELCAGSYVNNPIQLCPIPLNSFNIDYKGNINYCIQLSTLDVALNGSEIIGNIKDTSLIDARKELINRYILFAKRKIHDIVKNEFDKSDYFPCRYCMRYFAKTNE